MQGRQYQCSIFLHESLKWYWQVKELRGRHVCSLTRLMETKYLLVGLVIGQRHTRCFAGKRFPPVPTSETQQLIRIMSNRNSLVKNKLVLCFTPFYTKNCSNGNSNEPEATLLSHAFYSHNMTSFRRARAVISLKM